MMVLPKPGGFVGWLYRLWRMRSDRYIGICPAGGALCPALFKAPSGKLKQRVQVIVFIPGQQTLDFPIQTINPVLNIRQQPLL